MLNAKFPLKNMPIFSRSKLNFQFLASGREKCIARIICWNDKEVLPWHAQS